MSNWFSVVNLHFNVIISGRLNTMINFKIFTVRINPTRIQLTVNYLSTDDVLR